MKYNKNKVWGQYFKEYAERTESTLMAIIKLGEYLYLGRYFNEPILWRCVDIEKENGSLMLSDKIICFKLFAYAGNCPCMFSESVREAYGSNVWKDADIRYWLNGIDQSIIIKERQNDCLRNNPIMLEKGFLSDGNFTASERTVIKKVTQKSILNEMDEHLAGTEPHQYDEGNDKIWNAVANYDTAYSHDITDRMFLLDVKQLYRVYQNFGNYYRAIPTQKAVDNKNDKTEDIAGKYCDYWLRTPLSDFDLSYLTRCVTTEGDVEDWGVETEIGIRPAFFIDLTNSDFVLGDGSTEKPYIIQQ